MRSPDDPQQTCRVITDYRAAYPDPIIVSAGDELIVGEGDPGVSRLDVVHRW